MSSRCSSPEFVVHPAHSDDSFDFEVVQNQEEHQLDSEQPTFSFPFADRDDEDDELADVVNGIVDFLEQKLEFSGESEQESEQPIEHVLVNQSLENKQLADDKLENQILEQQHMEKNKNPRENEDDIVETSELNTKEETSLKSNSLDAEQTVPFAAYSALENRVEDLENEVRDLKRELADIHETIKTRTLVKDRPIVLMQEVIERGALRPEQLVSTSDNPKVEERFSDHGTSSRNLLRNEQPVQIPDNRDAWLNQSMHPYRNSDRRHEQNHNDDQRRTYQPHPPNSRERREQLNFNSSHNMDAARPQRDNYQRPPFDHRGNEFSYRRPLSPRLNRILSRSPPRQNSTQRFGNDYREYRNGECSHNQRLNIDDRRLGNRFESPPRNLHVGNAFPPRRQDQNFSGRQDHSSQWRPNQSPPRRPALNPVRQPDRSPPRNEGRSPPRNRSRSPPRRPNRITQRSTDYLQQRHQNRSPPRNQGHSPPRRQDLSPFRRQERSPPRRQNQSPLRNQPLQSSSGIRNRVICVYCNGMHEPSNCGKLTTSQDRDSFLLDAGLCRRCLEHHRFSNCPNSQLRCTNCGSNNHHTSICQKQTSRDSRY